MGVEGFRGGVAGGQLTCLFCCFIFLLPGLINAPGEWHSWRRGGKPGGENKEQRATRGAAIKLLSSC